MQMKRERREHKINRVAMWWTLGVFVLAMLMGISAALAHQNPESLWRPVTIGLILLYGAGIIWYWEMYQKLLDERIRIRNAEASRITGGLLFGLGMMYLMSKQLLNLQWPDPSLMVMATFTWVLYFLVYFVLWFRSR